MDEINRRMLQARGGLERRLRRCATALVLCVLVLPVTTVRAQFGSTAEVEREIPSTNTLDPTAAGTTIRVTDRTVAQSSDELLKQAAGTRVVKTGAAGRPFCLRLRGAPCDQSTVLLGDIPLSNPDTGDFDLSLIPIEAISEIEVFRGGAPAWLNQGAIGGVLRLMPRTYDKNEVGIRVTGGSFGTWRANVFGGGGGEKVQAFATATAAGTQGNFPYTDDGSTIFDPSDDVERTRQNSDVLEGFGLGNLVVETSEKSNLNFVFFGIGRDRGEPGPGSAPALQARMQTTRLFGSAAWTQEDDGSHPYKLQLVASYDYGRDRFDDRFAEIGTGGPQLTDDRNHSVFGRAATEIDLTSWLELTGIVSARYFFRDPEDELATMAEPTSDRFTVGGTVETNFHAELGDVLFELRPSVLLSWTSTSIQFSRLGTELANTSTDFLPTYRVGGVIAPLTWLAFRGSVSSGSRLPDLLQLFGDRSTIVGNPELVPEHSLGYDVGVTARGHAGKLSGYTAVGFFLRNVEDEIRFRRVSQFSIIAENIASGRNLGVELEVRGAITEHFLIIGEFTWTQSTDEATGNQLPGQPEFVAFARPEVHSGMLSRVVSDLLLFAEVSYLGDSYADPANLIVIRARTTLSLGIGALLFDDRLGLGFRADDLSDARGQDLLGFPLPGRQFSGRISYRETW